MCDDKTSSNVNPTRGILFRERGLLSEFEFFTLTPNIIDGIADITVAAGSPPVTLAQLPALTIDDLSDRVWLSATVAWEATVAGTTVEFRIYRNVPLSGPLIFNTFDFQATAGAFTTTSFSHVDFPVITTPGETQVLYFLVINVLGGTATFSGPITFTGAEIEANRICNP